MKKSIYLFMFLVLTMGLILAACGNDEESQEGSDTSNEETTDRDTDTEDEADIGEDRDTESEMPENLTVDLINEDEENVGTAELAESDEGVVITLNASGLPEGEFGFHFHENGQCDAPDFESAGDHFNPTDASHGTDHEDGPHAGDLPNLVVGEDGEVQEEITAEHVTLQTGEENSLLDDNGTSLVIHTEADDYETQPSGDAGDRMLCGVVSR
ncbi:superoxide dismutase family protein [Jeotgalibacillus proteolyticus]|uniref:Superoxide dismutase family protein n=1 Tax=Jeotgalibacillus proteolyticus TaxID=2082395 RepID=A0A2S5GDN1_9BACL|nr:superoxide dismutase family protein [Jeotgalibacillus proteolyticus]PPA71025.1 superoxide dismutase family protein [Jeotgalibacillus proteolyticus]